MKARVSKGKPGSDLEETFAFQLRALKLAGYERELVFAPPRRFRFDFAWPDRMIAVELDGGIWSGGRHVRPRGAESDAEKFTLAASLGWRVVRLTSKTVEDGTGVATVEAMLDAS